MTPRKAWDLVIKYAHEDHIVPFIHSDGWFGLVVMADGCIPDGAIAISAQEFERRVRAAHPFVFADDN